MAAWEVTNGLVDDLAALNGTLTDLKADVTAAEDAIANGANADPSGLGLNLVDYGETVTFTSYDDVTVFESETDTTISNFGTAGIDRLFFGEGYTFVEMGEDETTADALGDVAILEIFADQTTTGVDLYVENFAFAGNGSTPSDMTKVTLTGVDLDALSFNIEAGILSASEDLIA
ncbi:hypothetical protein EV663_10624 [Rhodovulum bhavnagarense]|uniref:Uncharacterized protein n=1 Tax=Rhodovulum bhavnagarense TaxID=992286 RepID=A0A4R2RF63_9RHOB|nr:hypothetical protein [Rhodovulum bhavnagarense]TCP61078.1 hypothetical protein EV663_10624 [Rhodovulum bhavnagarense]